MMIQRVAYTVCYVVAAESRHCTVTLTAESQIHIVGGGTKLPTGHTDTVGCGTESQPWSVQAMTGQRIAVSLINLSKT